MGESRINNIDFSKYKETDTIRVRGLSGDVFKENEYGELIDPIEYVDASYIKKETKTKDLLSFDFEQFVLSAIADECYIDEINISDISIGGDSLGFWSQENDEGYPDRNGEYFVFYSIAVEINNTIVEEADLAELFPNCQY